MLKKTIVLSILIVIASCSNDKEKYTKTLNKKLDDLNELLVYIESNFSDVLLDTLNKRERIVFVNCEEVGNLSKDYMCDSKDVIRKLKNIGLRKVSFEKETVNCETDKIFTRVYFQEKKFFYYPIVYYLFEYCETKDPKETYTIYYKPVNDHWSVLIDSNFP